MAAFPSETLPSPMLLVCLALFLLFLSCSGRCPNRFPSFLVRLVRGLPPTLPFQGNTYRFSFFICSHGSRLTRPLPTRSRLAFLMRLCFGPFQVSLLERRPYFPSRSVKVETATISRLADIALFLGKFFCFFSWRASFFLLEWLCSLSIVS